MKFTADSREAIIIPLLLLNRLQKIVIILYPKFLSGLGKVSEIASEIIQGKAS
jgi:hypothetical protein